MTYEQALEFWFGRINYEKRTLKPGDIKLDRVKLLLERLGNPHVGMPIVHIAGSKGKGSTAAMLAAILQKAGFRTGLFTSPHLMHVEERIQIDGQSIPRDDLANHMSRIQAEVTHLDKLGSDHEVTFFEIITALGFLHFAQQRVEMAVLEVGLGGRLDATNICDPMLSIITSIGFDHVQQLGNTLAKIAYEKAGIIKPGRPVLSGSIIPEPREVIERIAAECGSRLKQLQVDFHYTYHPGQIRSDAINLPQTQITTGARTWPPMSMKLQGEHQTANAALVVAAVEELRGQGMTIPDEAIAYGLQHVRWPARFEIIRQHPLVILDCAHNISSMQTVLDTLQSVVLTDRKKPARRYLIYATSHDKDSHGMLNLLAPHFDHIFLTRYSNNPRFVLPEELARILEENPRPYSLSSSSPEAWQQACEVATEADLICVTGSVFLAGELRPYLEDTLRTSGIQKE